MIKNILLFALVISLFSCKEEVPKDYVTLSGKITNHLGNDGFVQSKNYKKEIKISKDGVFSDTLHLKEEGTMVTFSDGNEYTSMYLKNGDELHLTLDTKEFDETVKYTGKGEATNNYLAQKALMSEGLYSGNLFDLPKEEFKSKVIKITSKFQDFLGKAKGLDKSFIKIEKANFFDTEKQMLSQYEEKKVENDLFSSMIGKASPKFNYENYKGGTTSLKSLRGQYVYVDVWATWCGPCKAEIPFLQKLEKEYHGKNIAFVSISIDDGSGYKDRSKELAKQGWRDMIKEKKMSGIQLYADKGWKSDFVTGYKINGIPRFLLIDPNGSVVDPNTSRPSSPKTKEMFNRLLK